MIKKILALVLLASSAYSVDWPFSVSLPETPDSVRVTHYSGTGTIETRLLTGTYEITDTFALVENKLNQIVLLCYYPGYGYPTGWVFQRDLNTSYATTEYWPIHAYWSTPIDSVRLIVKRDGATAGSYLRTLGYNYDTTLTAITGKYNEAELKLYYDGFSSPASWVWAWDITDTGSITSIGPTYAGSCLVQGQVISQKGENMTGVTVVAYTGAQQNLTGITGSSRYIIATRPVQVVTDSAGMFSMSLVGTSQYTDTTYGFYTIVGTKKNAEIFKISNLWVPSSGVLNLADSIASRTK